MTMTYSFRHWLKYTALWGLLALTLAACGGAGATASATATATGHTLGSLTPIPCTGSYTASPAGTLTLSNQGAASGSAHSGDTFQIVLDGGHVWRLQNVSGSATAENQVGMYDRVSGNCVWRFKATTPGSALMVFTGVQNCPRGQMCPAYAILGKFSVQVS